MRELLANANDALDKIRFESLSNKNALDSNPELKIYVKANPEDNTITIKDTGVGMTKKQLQENLGTIAKSGTLEFLKAFKDHKTDANLIGQFGVGFYSSFLVADRVTVVSKNNEDQQWVWESTSHNSISNLI